LLGVSFAEQIGFSDADRETVFFVALLGASGCTADSATLTAAFGDDLEAGQWLATADFKHSAQLLLGFVQHFETEGNV
jgi:type IV pilus biogenesis protein CpaD/CtpE